MFLGVDIGGTKCALVRGEGTRVDERVVFATETERGPEYALERLRAEAARLGTGVDAVGISCGGPLDAARGVVLSPPNLPGWDRVEIVRLLGEAAGAPAFLQNDADACALAEWRYGAGAGAENLIFLTFGTGLGAGLILGGRLYSGGSGMAGEAGHIRLREYGPVGYGKAGSFEGFCSGGGIRQLAELRLLERRQRGEPGPVGEVTAKTVAEAAWRGEAWAAEVYAEAGSRLGEGLAVLVDLLNPDVIVLGGIYPRSRELLEPSMRAALAAEALGPGVRHCRIEPAALGESLGDAAALCVAEMGLRRAKAGE